MLIPKKKEELFSNHLSNHTFKYDNCSIKFEELYKILKDDNINFPGNLFNIEYFAYNNCYLLTGCDDDTTFYFFDYLINLELVDIKTKKIEIKPICSTYEIYLIIEHKKNCIFYYDDKRIVNNNINPNMVNKEENKITLNYYEEKLEVIKFKAQYIDNKKNINFFQIDYLFPFIAEIIEELTVDSNDIFFDYTLFKNHTGSTIGGFLELITINKIKKN